MNNQPTVLLFAKSIDGGTGSFVNSLQKLKLHGFKLKTLVLEKPSGRKKIPYTYITAHPVHFYPAHYKFSLHQVGVLVSETVWFVKNVKKYKPDVILSMDVHCNLIVTFTKYFFRSKTKVILTTHINLESTLESKSSFVLRYFISRVVRFFYKKADMNIYSSERMKDSFKKQYSLVSKSKVIAYGVKPDAVLKSTKPSSEIKILSIGRLVEQKDFQTLINAFDEVCKRHANVRLDIIGDGPLKKRLAKFIHTKKSSHRIALLGWKQNTPKWIDKANIFVLTSKREGFPYVLLEALSVGRPIISTDAPFGPAEILDNGKYGYLVPVGDVMKLAEKIELLVKSPELRRTYERKAKERAEFYSEDKMLKAYVDAITQVLNKQ